uniref:Uncharacterized protein n=1 Tax=Anguilla anguilla TaxID=7936 RepID=A0A0E9TEH8_ANGAN
MWKFLYLFICLIIFI